MVCRPKHNNIIIFSHCDATRTVSGQGPMAGCCECGDEPSGSCATELVT
jgi:hypothetical protein